MHNGCTCLHLTCSLASPGDFKNSTVVSLPTLPRNHTFSVFIMQSALLLLLLVVCIISVSNAFVMTSNRIQRSFVKGAIHPTALLMSKASQEKADEKKRKQAMVTVFPSLSPHLVEWNLCNWTMSISFNKYCLPSVIARLMLQKRRSPRISRVSRKPTQKQKRKWKRLKMNRFRTMSMEKPNIFLLRVIKIWNSLPEQLPFMLCFPLIRLRMMKHVQYYIEWDKFNFAKQWDKLRWKLSKYFTPFVHKTTAVNKWS